MLLSIHAVAAGARLLDRVDPGWFDRIDTERLDIENFCDCGGGQLGAAGYTRYMRRIGLHRRQSQIEHGFWSPVMDDEKRSCHYLRLTAAWLIQIERRRRAADLLATSMPMELPLAA
jgi:hypothetical protein